MKEVLVVDYGNSVSIFGRTVLEFRGDARLSALNILKCEGKEKEENKFEISERGWKALELLSEVKNLVKLGCILGYYSNISLVTSSDGEMKVEKVLDIEGYRACYMGRKVNTKPYCFAIVSKSAYDMSEPIFVDDYIFLARRGTIESQEIPDDAWNLFLEDLNNAFNAPPSLGIVLTFGSQRGWLNYCKRAIGIILGCLTSYNFDISTLPEVLIFKEDELHPELRQSLKDALSFIYDFF